MALLNSEYAVHLGILIAIYTLLGQSLNLTVGLGRIFNLAHIASYAIGAYGTALLSTSAGGTFWECVAFSAALCGLFAFFLGAIAARLSSDYLAVGTLAFSAIVSAILVNWRSLTNGVLGITAIPRPHFWGIDFSSNINFLILLGVIMAITQTLLFFLFSGTFGRSLRAAGESDTAALALGTNTGRTRTMAFIISAAIAGVAGSFFSFYLNYIDPSSFSLSEMMFILTIVIVGRPGSFWGVPAAAAALVLLPESLRLLDISSTYLGPTRQLLYASILFLFVWIRRESLFPMSRRI
jgi:branched-chain amino acid transport system permease protein